MPLHVLHWLSRWQLQRKRLDKSAVRLQLMVIYLFFIYLKLSSKGPNQQATNSFSDDACPKFKLLSITTGFSRASTFLRKRCKFDQLRENCISLHSVAAWCGVNGVAWRGGVVWCVDKSLVTFRLYVIHQRAKRAFLRPTNVIRSTPPSRPNDISGSQKCPYVRPYVRPSTKSFSISMKFGIQVVIDERWKKVYDHARIQGQGQGHEPMKVGNSTIFNGYLLPHL